MREEMALKIGLPESRVQVRQNFNRFLNPGFLPGPEWEKSEFITQL